MYGNQDTKRYPAQQEKFFENSAKGLNRREVLLGVCGLGGGLSLIIGGLVGTKASNSGKGLPINVGPLQPPQLGPRGKK